jgi:hypothetical protein
MIKAAEMKILLTLAAIVLFLVPILPAKAVCPVCTIAVGAGVGIAEEFGVDDIVIGLWVGGLTVSLIFWTLDWLKKKKIASAWAEPLTILFYFLFVIAPLFFIKTNGYPIIGKELNKFWGIDKMLLGILIGSILFFSGARLYEYLKKKNNGRAHFPYQKVFMPIAPLAIASIIFYFITR